jgi:hypothetical protein
VDDPSHPDFLSDSELDHLKRNFENSMKIAHSVMGKAAFRRWPVVAKRRGPVNRAVFEAQAIAFAKYSLSDVLPHKDEIAKKLRLAFDDNEYLEAVTVSTGSIARIRHRLDETRRIVEAIVA